MRRLNQTEQKLSAAILNSSECYLPNILDEYFRDCNLVVNRLNKSVVLRFSVSTLDLDDDEANRIISRIDQITLLILEAVSLLEMLKDAGLIYILQTANVLEDESTFGSLIEVEPMINRFFPDAEVSALLIQYLNKRIYHTIELEDFCKNGFILRDERANIFRNRIAIAALCVAVGMPIFLFCLKECWNKKQDYSSQYKDVTIGLQGIRQSIDSALALQLRLSSVLAERHLSKCMTPKAKTHHPKK